MAKKEINQEYIEKLAKSAGKDISSFDIKELIKGFKIEHEHKDVADKEEDYLLIAIAHLKEAPNYYTKLNKYVENNKSMEKTSKIMRITENQLRKMIREALIDEHSASVGVVDFGPSQQLNKAVQFVLSAAENLEKKYGLKTVKLQDIANSLKLMAKNYSPENLEQ